MSSMNATLMEPFAVGIDLTTGAMPEATNHIVRKASDMAGYYADESALQRLVDEHDDPLHYEVFEVPVPEDTGQLMYCISKLQPGRVGKECFMTKGHYHTVESTAEVYLGLQGEGYMVMKSRDGQHRHVRMERGRMVYVPPYWAHRSVNTSWNEPLISFCVYPGDAGHNYGDIQTHGFPIRVQERDGQIVVEDA